MMGNVVKNIHIISSGNNTAFFRFFVLLLIATGSFVNITRAQDTLLTIPRNSRLDSINSTILNQKRYIQVFTPQGYVPGSADKYDVLYVLDGGNWNISIVTQVQHFIEGQGHMPPTIIVSVMGIDRNVELTPTHLQSWNAPTGGAANFLGYIKNELIPHINKNYPSNGDNTIWGHSLGGMFVLYAMLHEPSIFKSYIAVDPSVWWDDCLVAKMAADKLPALADLKATLYISGREGPDFHGMRIDTMDIVLKQFAPAGLHWKIVAYPDETHASVRLKTTYDGLRFTYAGHSSDIEFYPTSGMVAKNKPFTIKYFDDTTRLYYTLDGTTPTEASTKVEHNVTITSGATVTYKHFTNRSKYDKTTTGVFINGETLKPVLKPKNATPGGFNYAYYEGDGDKQPDVKSLKPLKTGIMNKDFNPDSLHRKNNYALVIDGLMETKEDGYYMFFLRAGKGAKLYIGDKLLIQWDDNYKRENWSYTVPLAKGFYPIRIEYFDKKDDYKLLTAYMTPATMASGDTSPIPFEAEYSTR